METKRATTAILLALLTIGLASALAGLAYVWLQYRQGQEQELPPEPMPMHTYVDDVLQTMSTRDKVANLFILHTPGTAPDTLHNYMRLHKPSGLIFMGDNIPDETSRLSQLTNNLTIDDKLPPFVAIDEEGDTVKRLQTDTYAGAETLRNLPAEDTKDAFTQRSHLLKGHGFNLNFGIVADVTDDTSSFIYPRVLGTNAHTASERVKTAVEGSAGITLSALKHFPGHGETNDDSHKTIPHTNTSYNDWEERVAPPFKAGIDAGADMLMFGHLRYSAIDTTPASLSKKWHEIARNDLGFQGIIVTDDMLMLQNSGDEAYLDPVKNAVSALQAGSDLLLYVLDHEDEVSRMNPENLINGVVKAVENGDINEEQLNETVKKLLTIRYNLRTD